MELTCEALGITPEQIAEKVATKIADDLMRRKSIFANEDGDPVERVVSTEFGNMISQAVTAKVAEGVALAAEKIVGERLVENLTALRFPQTNGYGETKREPLTLLEFVAQRVDTFLTERVDHEGRSGSSGYSTKDNTRVVWMIDKHLKYTIESHMQQVLADANSQITGGILDACKIALADVLKRLKQAKV